MNAMLELQFLQASELGGQTAMFRPALDGARDAIVRELSAGERQVSFFTREWVNRPGDFLIEKQYKEVLLALEAAGVIEVFDPRTNSLAPASLRRKIRGKPTLAPRVDRADTSIVRRRSTCPDRYEDVRSSGLRDRASL